MQQESYRCIEDVDATAEQYSGMQVPVKLRDKKQRFCVLSVVAPQEKSKCKDVAIRVYGCTKTLTEAKDWAQRLRDSNPYFSVYSLDCHEWAALPPDISQIGDVHSNDERVQRLHDQFKAEEVARKKALEDQLDVAHRKPRPALPLPEAQEAAPEEDAAAAAAADGDGAEESKVASEE